MKRCLLLLSVLIFSTLSFSQIANAHSGVVTASPAQDEAVTALPSQLVVTFTEDLMTIGDKVVNTISLTDPNGSAVALTDIAVAGAKLSAAIPEGEYPSGTYTVDYAIVSADGHKLTESYTFALNAPTLFDAPVPTSVQADEDEGEEALPLPIVGAIVVVALLGGLYAYRRFNKKK